MKIYDENGNLVPLTALAVDLGEMDDTATADDLSDITTTSALAKLRRILLRFSADAFAATIRGASRTDVESMLGELAKYFVADGGIFDLKIQNGVNRDNLNLILRDFFAVVGCDGVNMFNPVIDGSTRTTFDYAFKALSDYIVPLAERLDIKIQNGTNKNTLKEIIYDFLAVVGCDNVNMFNPVINGSARTTFDAAFKAISDYFVPLAETLDIKINNGTNKNTLKEILQDYFTMIGCLNTNVFNPTIGGSARTTFKAAFVAIGALIDALENLSAANVATELETYDAVKRSEATSDKNEIIGMIIAFGG